jgi:hypothetical protein
MWGNELKARVALKLAALGLPRDWFGCVHGEISDGHHSGKYVSDPV